MSSLGFIHTLLPGDTDRTLLLLHGTGGDENDLLELGKALDPRASLLAPRGLVEENGANRFFRRLSEGVFDEADIVRQAASLARFVTEAEELYGLTPGSSVAFGFSNGANMAAALLFLHPAVLSRAILIRAMAPLKTPPDADLNGKRVLLLSGQSDPIVPKATADKLATELRQRSAEVDHRWFPTGHGLTREDLESARAWLAE